MASSADLKDIFRTARPLIEQQLDLAEMVAALRDTATAKGLDWSQIKALLKAQIQDERDDNGGKRVKAIVAKAEHAFAYADMLGLAKMNEENFSASQSYSEAKGSCRRAAFSELHSSDTPADHAQSEGRTDDVGATASSTNSNSHRPPAHADMVEASTDKQAAGASRPTNSNSAAHSPAEKAGEAPSSNPASPATLSHMPISATPSFAGRVTGDMPDIPDFLRRTEPKAREWEGA